MIIGKVRPTARKSCCDIQWPDACTKSVLENLQGLMYYCFPTGCSYIAIQISDMTGSMQGCAYSYEALLAGYSRTLYITKGVIIKKEGEIECSKNISSRVVFRGKRALPLPYNVPGKCKSLMEIGKKRGKREKLWFLSLRYFYQSRSVSASMISSWTLPSPSPFHSLWKVFFLCFLCLYVISTLLRNQHRVSCLYENDK